MENHKQLVIIGGGPAGLAAAAAAKKAGLDDIRILERDSQLLMPVFDYCMPDKDCNSGAGCGCGCCCGCEDPCDLFQNIKFPVNQFFPPNSLSNPRDYECTKQYCNNCRN